MFEDEPPSAAALARTAPSADLARAVDLLLDRPDLSERDAVLAMQAAQRLVNHYQDAVGRLAVRVAAQTPDEWDWGREEVAAALHISGYASDKILTTARALGDRLPLFAAALREGAITYAHAHVLREASETLDLDLVARAEPLLLPHARRLPVGRFARKVREVLMGLDPTGAQQRHEAAVERETGMGLFPRDDAMVDLLLTMPAHQGLDLYADCDERAGQTDPDDARTLGQRRVDALLTLVAAGKAAPIEVGAAKRRGRRRRASVVVDIETLLGLAEHPGTLPGYGPIPAPLARELAGDARWEMFVVGTATRYLEGLSTETYTPTARIEQFLTGRHQVCGAPTCNQPAYLCETDHTLPWPDGPTDVANLGPLCKRHHLLKHHGGWGIQRARDGTLRWTSPLGFHYDEPPHRYDVTGMTPDVEVDGAA